MAKILRQSTAYTFRLGPFLDSTDGNTQENALTIAATDVLLSKAGGALAAKNEATALTGTGANAHYTCPLNATDTNTVGTFRVFCHVTGALAVWEDFQIIEEAIFDALYGASADGFDANQRVNVGRITGTAQTARDLGANIDATVSSRALEAGGNVATILGRIVGTLAAGTHNPQSGDGFAIVNHGTHGNGALDTDLNTLLSRIVGTLATGTHQPQGGDAHAIVNNGTHGNAALNTDLDTLLSRIVGTLGAGTHNPQGGDTFTRIGAPVGASISADIASVKTDTGNLVSRITSTLFSGITSLAQWLGLMAGKQVGNATARTEVRATGAGSGTFDETTDALEALRDTAPMGTAMRGTDNAALASVCTEARLSELGAANIPADIDTLNSKIVGTLATGTHNPQSGDAFNRIGANGAGLTALGDTRIANLNATVASRSSHGAADVWTSGTRALTDKAGFTISGTKQTLDALNDITAASVWTAGTRTLTTIIGVNKNTALNNFEFLMVNSSGDPQTGLTITAERSIDGASFASCTNTSAEVGSGVYRINLSATDLNGDVITLKFTAAGARQTTLTIKTSA